MCVKDEQHYLESHDGHVRNIHLLKDDPSTSDLQTEKIFGPVRHMMFVLDFCPNFVTL